MIHENTSLLISKGSLPEQVEVEELADQRRSGRSSSSSSSNSYVRQVLFMLQFVR